MQKITLSIRTLGLCVVLLGMFAQPTAVTAFSLFPMPPYVLMSAAPTTILTGGSSVIVWTVTSADSCVASDGWSGVKNNLGGSQQVAPTVTTTYTLTCTGAGGTHTASITIVVEGAPSGQSNLKPVTAITTTNTSLTHGEAATFSARAQNVGTQGTEIGFHNNFSYRWGSTGGWTDLSPFNSKSALAAGALGTVDTSPSLTLTNTGTLDIQYCVDSHHIIAETDESDNCVAYRFTVASNPTPADPPVITLSANPTNLTVGESSVVTWTVSNADTCTASGGWSGAKNATGGNQTVAPGQTTTYTLTCTGAGGTDTKHVTITVTAAPAYPTCSLNASDNSLTVGELATLTWTSNNAFNASLNQGIGVVDLEDAKAVSPVTTTTYTLTVTGTSGTANCSEIITVTAAPVSGQPNLVPTGSITTTGGELVVGNTVTFVARVQNTGDKSTELGFHNRFSYRWGAASDWTDMNPMNSKVALAADTLANPDSSPSLGLSQTGTLAVRFCADAGKVITESDEDDNCTQTSFSVTDSLTPLTPPTITFTGSPTTINSGQSSVLNWTVQNADTCTASGGWSGSKNAQSGSQTATPAQTTSYTLTCTGAGGSDSEQVTITVQSDDDDDDDDGGDDNPPGGTTINLTFRVCDPGVVGCVTNSGTKYVAPSAPLEIRWSAPGATSCVGTNFSTNNQTSGVKPTTASGLPANSTIYRISCTNGGLPVTRSITVITNAEKPELRVSPTLIRAGEPVTIEWDTKNGDESLCVLGGAGINSAATLDNGTLGPDTGKATKQLWSKSTFTLTCGTLAADPVTVEIRPSAYES